MNTNVARFVMFITAGFLPNTGARKYRSEHPVFIRPSIDGTYYGMALSVRPSVRPSVCLSVCLSVRPFTIAFERDILKSACQIDFTFWCGLHTTKTSQAIDFGHSTKTKMAATSVWRLTLYPIQDMACGRDILKSACQIDFPFWYGLNTTKTSNALIWGILRKPRLSLQQFED